MKTIAIAFATSLDNDDFDNAKSLLSRDCVYHIGSDKIVGPEAICRLYEQNMLEGRKKLDSLVWGKSEVEQIGENAFCIHFTDYLTHQSIAFTYRCRQHIRFGDDGAIILIEHIDDPAETGRLDAFYRRVGLK